MGCDCGVGNRVAVDYEGRASDVEQHVVAHRAESRHLGAVSTRTTDHEQLGPHARVDERFCRGPPKSASAHEQVVTGAAGEGNGLGAKCFEGVPGARVSGLCIRSGPDTTGPPGAQK